MESIRRDPSFDDFFRAEKMPETPQVIIPEVVLYHQFWPPPRGRGKENKLNTDERRLVGRPRAHGILLDVLSLGLGVVF